MTREEVKKLLPVLQAFVDGKTIQYKGGSEEITDLAIGNFERNAENYRIKSTPTYRPFANAEECWNEMLKHQPFGWVKNSKEHLLITYIYDNGINVGEVSIGYRNFDKAFRDLKFIDDTPFGVKVEEE